MKHTFNTLEEVKQAIEKWFITLGFDNPERAEKQYLKIIAEVGEMADALCKEDFENFKSEAGDVFVTIVGYCLQTNRKLFFDFTQGDGTIESLLKILCYCICNNSFTEALDYLQELCLRYNTNLLECTTIAYNKIQDRL